MKIGTFFLVFIVLGGYFLWKYQGYLKGLLATIPAPSGTVRSAIAKYATSILLVAVILVVVFLGIFSSVWESLSFAAVSRWAWKYWALIAIIATACSALIALHKKELGAAAQVLQTALSLVLVFVFIVCYVIGWFEGPTTQRPTAATMQGPARNVCQDVNATQTSSCVITREWSNWIKPENSARDVGKQFCFQPKMPMERKDEGGSASWRFRIEGEEHTTLLYRLGANCNTVVF